MRTCMHTCVHACACVCVRMCMRMCVHACMCVCVCMRACVYVCLLFQLHFKLCYVLYKFSSSHAVIMVRLVNGNGPSEGRVEIFYNGTWGTVCGDAWNANATEVVCRELGFPSAVGTYKRAHFGQGNGTIWLDNVRCTGREDSISRCTHNGWGSLRSCSHVKDLGVVCQRECAFFAAIRWLVFIVWGRYVLASVQ